MLRMIALSTEARSARGVGPRSAILVAASGPYRSRIERAATATRLRRLALGGSVSAMHTAMTIGPHMAVERVASSRLDGPAVTPEQKSQQRKVVWAGTAATAVAGLALQRFINHSGMRGPVAEAGRLVGSQIAIGGVACALVMGTDTVMRRDVPAEISVRRPAVVGLLVVVAQSWALKKVSPIVTLPPRPRHASIPVQGRWRAHSRTLDLA